MSLVRRLARPLISAVLVSDGWRQMREPEARAAALHPLLDRLRGTVPGADDPQLVVKTLGAVQLGAATLFALGRAPRASAAVLLAAALPGAAADYLRLREDSSVSGTETRKALLTRLSIAGGLLLSVVDLDGRPGLAWRARQAADDTQALGRRARRSARRAAKKAGIAR